MRQIMILMIILLAACRPDTPSATAIPTTPPLTGSVTIEYPQDGTIVYAEALWLSGTAANLPNNQFTIRVIGADEETITQTTVQPDSAGTWQVELIHNYNGDPTETTIIAVPNYPDAPENSDYDIRQVVLAASSQRPEGIFGSIIAPFEGDSIGGDTIPVSGTVSGVFENTFILALIGDDGRTITSQPITVMNPYFMDDVPWTADLATNGYTGSAEIRAFAISAQDGSEIPLASANIMVTQDAG